MLSSQTLDTVTAPTIWKLQRILANGLDLEDILNIDEQELDTLIGKVGFHTKKAGYIKRTAEILKEKWNGDIPDTVDGLCSLPGVGEKMAHLCMQAAWKKYSLFLFFVVADENGGNRS
jgi:endonuclease III